MLENVSKRPIMISSATTLLFFLTGMLIGNNSITCFILGGIIIGFITGNDYKLGLKLGAITGIVSATLILILNITLLLIIGTIFLLISFC